MMEETVEQDVRNFVASIAAMCTGCFRRGYTCATCPCATATVLVGRMEEHKATASEERLKISAARQAAIIAHIRRKSPAPCYASEIVIEGCPSNLRSMALAALVKDGKLDRHDMGPGRAPYYTISHRKDNNEGQIRE